MKIELTAEQIAFLKIVIAGRLKWALNRNYKRDAASCIAILQLLSETEEPDSQGS